MVLVTGASGFIGAMLARALVRSYRVVGLDAKAPVSGSSRDIPFLEIDLTSDQSVRAALQRVRAEHGARIASVIHLAAYFDLTGEPNPKYEQVTIRGTERLLRELKAFELEQFVFASTMLVHAPAPRGTRINEDSPLEARFPYRISKLEAERLVRAQHGAIPVVIIRPAGVYDDLGRSTFLAHQIARIYQRTLLSHLYPGDLNTGQPSLHLDDLIDALLRIVERRKALPVDSKFLLGEPETPSFGELQRAIGYLIYGEEWETRRIAKAVAKSGAWLQDEVLEEDVFIKPWMVDSSDDHYELDIAHARELLGWEPRHSLRATLPTIVEALKSDPVGWYRANKLNAAAVAAQQSAVVARDSGDEMQARHPSQRDGGANDHNAKRDRAEHPHSRHDHTQQMQEMHLSMLWVHFINIALGALLATSPFIFGSFDPQPFTEAILRVTAERALPAPELRSIWLGYSDVLSGLAIVLFGALSLSRRFAWAQWANTAVGIWLLFAPLVFWAPSPAVYTTDTLIGALVIAFAVLVPMMPGMSHESMMDESDLPPGWSYCPSTYLQRLPIIALGLIGFLISRVLTAYQLGHIDGVWEPFFAGQHMKNGTEFIITSDVSKAWPIPDAGLGAVSYMFEVLMGVMGDSRRWRTMPWMVAMFGFVVVPLGAVSIYFIVIQPIVIGTYCTPCLIAALAMLIMIPFTLDELVAMGQYLAQAHRRGERLLRVFFQGGASPGSGKDQNAGFDTSLTQMLWSAARGVNVPWTLLASAALGVWLMCTRLIFASQPPMANSDHLVGALIVTVAVMAMAEVGRALRFINVAFGLWLIAAPWLLSGASPIASWAGVVVGVAVIALSLPRGRRSREHYGGWDCYIV
jgi:nucleoside-diphosphate-sugar epimerase/uncharacterized membrane protein